MGRYIRIFVFVMLSSLTLATSAQRPTNTIDAYAVFSEMYANAPVGGCGCFWMAGGYGGISVPVWRNFPPSSRQEATPRAISRASTRVLASSMEWEASGCAYLTTHVSSPLDKLSSAGCMALTATFRLRSASLPPVTIHPMLRMSAEASTSPFQNTSGYAPFKPTTSTLNSETFRATDKINSVSAPELSSGHPIIIRDTNCFGKQVLCLYHAHRTIQAPLGVSWISFFERRR
jgi:hypothetical protein